MTAVGCGWPRVLLISTQGSAFVASEICVLHCLMLREDSEWHIQSAGPILAYVKAIRFTLTACALVTPQQ